MSVEGQMKSRLVGCGVNGETVVVKYDGVRLVGFGMQSKVRPHAQGSSVREASSH
jgi:hypothetical protein